MSDVNKRGVVLDAFINIADEIHREYHLPEDDELRYSATWSTGSPYPVYTTVYMDADDGEDVIREKVALSVALRPSNPSKDEYYDLREDGKGPYAQVSGIYGGERGQLRPGSESLTYKAICWQLYHAWGEPLPAPLYDHTLPTQYLEARAASDIILALHEAKNAPALAADLGEQLSRLELGLFGSTNIMPAYAAVRIDTLLSSVSEAGTCNTLNMLAGRTVVHGLTRDYEGALWWVMRMLNRFDVRMTVNNVQLVYPKYEPVEISLQKATLSIPTNMGVVIDLKLEYAELKDSIVVDVMLRLAGAPADKQWFTALRWTYPSKHGRDWMDVSPLTEPAIILIRALAVMVGM